MTEVEQIRAIMDRFDTHKHYEYINCRECAELRIRLSDPVSTLLKKLDQYAEGVAELKSMLKEKVLIRKVEGWEHFPAVHRDNLRIEQCLKKLEWVE